MWAAYAAVNITPPAGASPDEASAAGGQTSAGFSRVWLKTLGSGGGKMPAYAGGVIYYAVGSKICAVRSADGSVLWTCSGNVAFQSPSVSGCALFAGSDDRFLYRIDLKDGSVVWKKPADTGSALAAANGRVYFSGTDGSICALDAASGNSLWSFPSDGIVKGSLATDDDGHLYFAADGKVNCLDGDTGHRKWQARLFGNSDDAFVSCDVDNAYAATGQTLYALNAISGKTRWRAQFAGRITAAPTVGPGGVFVTTDDDQLSAIDIQGHQRWSADIGSLCAISPVMSGKMVLVSGQGGALFGFGTEKGNLLWDYVLQPVTANAGAGKNGSNIIAMPFCADNSLCVASSTGELSCFQAQGTDQTGPVIVNVAPQSGGTVPSSGISFGATVVDEGSGVSPSAVTVSVDGKALNNVRYVASLNGIGPISNGEAPLSLPNGAHMAVIRAMDWKGNATEKTWTFIVVDGVSTTASADHPSHSSAPWDQPGYPYPKPSKDPAERIKQRRQAQEIYNQLMQEHEANGTPVPTPPPY